jgi:DNA repair protein RadA/Sms
MAITTMEEMEIQDQRRGRGRPPMVKLAVEKAPITVQTVKMCDQHFNDSLFVPMKTNTHIDSFFSSENGLMPGTNYVCTGDPGVGKTTVLLEIISHLKSQGKKVLFISGEMNAIDMVGYVKRYPKFAELDILFMSDYADADPDDVLRSALKIGYDVVLVDSMAELSDVYIEYFGGTSKSSVSKMLHMFEEHNLGRNEDNVNTTFLLIQQVTKGGQFVGSNKLKHMTTGMMHMKKSADTGERYLYFSKNRRGGNGNKLYFRITPNQISYGPEAPMNEEV